MIHIAKNYPKNVREKIDTFIKITQKDKKIPHYSNLPKGDYILQNALLAEQGYLCAYCMQRINFVNKVEHWDGQAATPLETLNYHNMLAVCGGKIQDTDITHCDTNRSKFQTEGKGVLTINPLDKQAMSEIKYLKNGTIYHDNAEKNNDLHEILNLNNIRLLDYRKREYESVLKTVVMLCKGKTADAGLTLIRKIVTEWKKTTFG